MRRTFCASLSHDSSATVEVWKFGRNADSWTVVLVVPERELERFGEAGIRDLLELADEIRGLVSRDRAA